MAYSGRRRVDTAIVTALNAEAQAVLNAFDIPRKTLYGGTPFGANQPVFFGKGSGRALYATGVGTVAAAVGLHLLLSRVAPMHLVCGGIGGTTHEELQIATPIVAARCSYYDRDASALSVPYGALTRRTPASFDLPAGARVAERVGADAGTFTTGDCFVDTDLLKTLPARWRDRVREAHIVDMESAAWVEEALNFGIQPIVIRTVSDTIGTPPGGNRHAFTAACRSFGLYARRIVERVDRRSF